jgi:DNA-binding SARP family transcriptional activator
MQHRWHITLFAELTAQQGSERMTQFNTRQTAGLLAFLAFYRQRAHSRELLADRLWPDEDSVAARSRLRTALWALRRILEPEGTLPGSVLIADRTEVRLACEAVTTDVERFESALAEAARIGGPAERSAALFRAASLYTGELLAGWHDNWVIEERNRLVERYRAALHEASGLMAGQGNLKFAIDYARRAVAADPYQEEAHAALIRLYVQTGYQVDAMRQYRELERRLAELSLKPARKTRELLVPPNDLLPLAATAPTPAMPPVSPLFAPLAMPPKSHASATSWEKSGGPLPLSSTYYIERAIDKQFTAAVARQESIVLVKGGRHVGKTSLLARSLHRARQTGSRVVLTDCQKLTAAQMETSEGLFLTLARDIAEQLDLELSIDEFWHSSWGWNVNIERFLRREALKAESGPLVWALDEVDRLFGRPDSGDIFRLFRSWYNARSLNPDGPWSRLTLAMAYATESYLFITDPNQSPFNVGAQLVLGDFTPEEVAELNRRYDSPLRNEAELARYMALVGGHPYLMQRGLHALALEGLDLEAFAAQASRDDGLFGDHLRRLWQSVQREDPLCANLHAILHTGVCPSGEAFFRLQSAGVLIGDPDLKMRVRCGLYQTYLERRLS